MDQEQFLECLREQMEGLTEREQEAMRLRFGLDGDKPRTLAEVAQHFGVTRERIRQIENKVIRRHMHGKRVKKIRDFYT